MIHDQDLPIHLWVEAARIVVYVKNRLYQSVIGFKTVEEMYTGKKPEVRHLKIFGCSVYVHIMKDKRTKLDPSGRKGIFVGYCKVPKSFKIYVLKFRLIDIIRDVTFDEETTLKKYRRCKLNKYIKRMYLQE